MERPGKNGGRLKSFEPGQSGNPAGRPKFVFSQLAATWRKEGVERATKARVAEAFEFLFGISTEQIKIIAAANEGEYPHLIISAAKELTEKGGRRFEMMKEMLDRAHGKSKQTTEHTGELTQNINLDSLSLSEKRTALALLQKADKTADE